jgi:phage shock protein A
MTEAEARLAALKAGGSSALPSAQAPAQITDGEVDAAFAALKAQDAEEETSSY